MSANPFFSIIVPTYNHANYVGAALDSLIAQTDPDWEAVVVNDGSTDSTPEVLARYAQRDSRIRVIHQPNGGTGAALNKALSHAHGEWVCWLSSDDFFDPKKLAIHRTWIQRDPSSRFYFTYFRLFNQANGTTVDHKLWGPLPQRDFQILGLFYRNYISGISICVHRQSWETVGRFNERLRYAQDYDMWLRLFARYPGTFIPEWTCINRHHSGQYSEIFPQACYYDTAAAGVQFLNEHPFEELFPSLDLRDPDSALRAVEQTLNQAADETAFLYWFGAHPNLVSRTLEWAWDRKHGTQVYQQRAPRQLARQMLADTARQLRRTPLGWYWQVASAAADMPEPDFTYSPMRPMDVGLGFLHDLRAQGKTDVTDLQRYFKMQYNVDLPTVPPKLARRTVVFCAPQPISVMPAPTSDAARQLHAAGCKVAVVTQGPNRLGHVDGIPLVEAGSQATVNTLVQTLLPVDAVVWHQLPDDLTPFVAKEHYQLTNQADTAFNIVDRILNVDSSARTNRRVRHLPVCTPRRKVVFIGRSPWGGGAERVTHDLLHALDPRKYELHFVHLFRSEGPQVEFDPAIAVHDVERELAMLLGRADRPLLWRRIIRRIGRFFSQAADEFFQGDHSSAVVQQLDPFLKSIKQAWPQVVALRDILARIGSDAMLIPVMEEATVRVWLAQAYVNQHYCASLHTVESHNLKLMYPDPDRYAIERFLFTNACRGASAITMPSHGCSQDLVQHFDVPQHLVDVVPNPIDVNSILQLSAEAPEVPMPTISGKCLFVHAARLSVEKNHHLLLDACRVLKQRVANFIVVCLGDGALRGELQQRVQAAGLQDHVLLLGAVKNPFAYMARAQGLVLTSQFESFALVLVEALACGAVPIAVDCPYGPREVLEHGKYGLLVSMSDASALADAMHRVIQDRDLRDRTRIIGSSRARHYELARIVSQWEGLIDDLTTSDKNSSQKYVAAG